MPDVGDEDWLAAHVGRVLREVWDPIGLGACGPVDEYDAYVPDLVGLTRDTAVFEDTLAAHLARIEVEAMHLSLSPAKRTRAARALLGLREARPTIPSPPARDFGRVCRDVSSVPQTSSDPHPPDDPRSPGDTGIGPVALGVTFFRPSPHQVRDILAALPPGLVAAFAFDNCGLSADDGRALAQAGMQVLRDGENGNLGIAEALNRIAAAARAAGARDLLLLDQDAAPPQDLAAALRAGMGRLRAAGIPVAVVGPTAAPAAGHKAPSYRVRPGPTAPDGLAPVDFLATSGSLIDLDAFARVGPFRADFFIDGVELEWCARAWARGFGSYRVDAVAIPHRVGGGTIRFAGIAMPRQPLFRMATYLRNSVYAWRLPHVPLRWKLAQAVYLPLQAGLYWADSGFRPAVLGRLAGAVLDGLRGRLGPPGDLP